MVEMTNEAAAARVLRQQNEAFQLQCVHALGVDSNEIGETICCCDIWARWRNVSLGECLGNCDSQETGGQND